MKPIVSKIDKEGSAVQLLFHEPRYLQAAAVAISNAHRTFPSCDKPAFMGPNKTRSEMRPNRITHRLGDHLKSIEDAKGKAAMNVVKKLDAKFVEVGGNLAAYVFQEALTWTKWGETRYTGEERKIATAWAEH